jgi:hypothetical protein
MRPGIVPACIAHWLRQLSGHDKEPRLTIPALSLDPPAFTQNVKWPRGSRDPNGVH